ncbi:hypothetical protein TKK_0008957 [Trichogramma kaykai]|uniref:C2H2-type domain-containing protein n=1 Tax=Trichogramma kaykai TaxID=54128 RepID=A0ABD2X3F4_9HYME
MESIRPLLGIKQECDNVSSNEGYIDSHDWYIMTSPFNNQDIKNNFSNESFVHGPQLANFSAVSQFTFKDEIIIDFECEDVKPGIEFLRPKISDFNSTNDSNNGRVEKYKRPSNIVEDEKVRVKKKTILRANEKNKTCKRERRRKSDGRRVVAKKGDSVVPNKIKPHKCKKCQKKFGKKDSLKIHFSLVHGHVKFECDICKKEFNDKGNLKNHIHNVHIRLKSHKCDECDKSFGRKGDLKKHIDRIHNCSKPHKCKVCKKSFFKRNDLTKHVDSVHTNKSRVICDICKKSLSRKDSLRNHIKNQHNKNKKLN